MTTPPLLRSAVVDLGSNSVRLVVFEGRDRNPVVIFNEKAVLRLGRGLQATGLLNPAGVEQALRVMARYAAVADAMHAAPFDVLATAAVRDATNGPAFTAALQERMPRARIRILSGAEEAALSSDGVLCGIPGADGLLADIGGGSLELVQVGGGGVRNATTLRLGVIRLADRAGNDVAAARAIADADLSALPWLGQSEGRDLYLVGGAWRALARLHMQHTDYPLGIVHHYTIDADAARALATLVLEGQRRLSRRRAEDLPYAAVVLRRLLRQSGAARVVFSANGIREGWFMQLVPPAIRAEDPLLAAADAMAASLGRDPAMPASLFAWTTPLFPDEPPGCRRLRRAACAMSDVGSHDHPEYRAEQAFWRILRQPGVGLTHADRAFLALAVALRYEADADAAFLEPARRLLEPAAVRRAGILGSALRLAYLLSAGTPALLADTTLRFGDGALVLGLDGAGVFSGESLTRRLDRLAGFLGVPGRLES